MLSASGLGLILASLFLVTTSSAFPGPWAALPVAGAALVTAAGIGGLPSHTWGLNNPASGYIGKISYSLYLWHFPVIILLAALLSRDSAAFYPLAIAIMIAASVASFHLVEGPVRRSSWLKAPDRKRSRRRRPRAVTIGFAAIGVLALAVTVLAVLALRPAPVTVATVAADVGGVAADAAALDATTVAAPAASDPQVGLTAEINTALDATQWPDLKPTIDEVVDTGFAGTDGKGCAPVAPEGRDCDYTSVDPAKLVMVAGDSMATAWLPGLRAALEPAGFVVKAATFPGCPFANEETLGTDQERADLCGAHREVVVDSINAAKPSLLILSHRPAYRFASIPDGAAQTGKWDESMSAVYERVRANVGRLVILGAAPQGKNPGECATRLASPADCEDTVQPSTALYVGVERAIATKLGGTYIDSIPWFCAPLRGCPIFVGTTVVRRDGYHVTPGYATHLAPLLAAALTAT